ncbi:hypothetical protein GIB67_025621 [Kingdonia uniflora]|uniref:Uncharacterized protein n=1 Tax=Kingdonia uniflora TaxID=39325 RepID=A0A7J7L8J5_9MAGN|nr:hypothetical protein GIB67_025621 [Kingdonia uniflora]
MEATRLSSTFLPSLEHFSKNHMTKAKKISSFTNMKISAARRDAYDHGQSVDEDMITLRKRIHETMMAEVNVQAPSNWMKWEKEYYKYYDSDICEAMGLLQTQLMKTRPSLALGILVLMSLSVLASSVMVMSHFVDLAKLILSGIHLS